MGRHFRICTEEGASEFQSTMHTCSAGCGHHHSPKETARFLYRHLLRRGANPRQAAGTAYSRRASGIAVTARGSMWRTRIRGSLPSGLHPMTSGALRTLQQKSLTSFVWRFESTIQRAGCEVRKSGSVRGAAGNPPCLLDSAAKAAPIRWRLRGPILSSSQSQAAYLHS